MLNINYTEAKYHRDRHGEYLANPRLCEAWAYFADDAYFREVKRGNTLLEYGGGLGINLLTVCQRAATYMLEPSPLGREVAAKYPIRTITTLSEVEQGQFDRILCRHVLEHLDNPLGTLQELKEYLKSGGRLTLVVPCEKPGQMPVAKEIDYHLYCWNPRTLSNLLARAGFKTCQIRFEYYGMRRRLLPVYEHLGPRAYVSVVRRVGKAFGSKEIVVECSRDES